MLKKNNNSNKRKIRIRKRKISTCYETSMLFFYFNWKTNCDCYSSFFKLFLYRTLLCLINGWKAIYQYPQNVLYVTKLVALYSGIMLIYEKYELVYI